MKGEEIGGKGRRGAEKDSSLDSFVRIFCVAFFLLTKCTSSG